MPPVIALISFLLLALGVSFLCSILEAALLSMPPSFVRQQEQTGSATGALLGKYKRSIDRPLAAILTLNTIAHTVGAAGVGAQAVFVFGEAYFGIISAALTLLILFLSEIIPKTLGAQHWRGLAGFTAYSCRSIVIATYPLVWLSEQITRLVQGKAVAENSVSRDELVAMAQLGFTEGVLDEGESRIIRNLIRLRQVKVENIMTPRTVLGALPESTTCREAMDQRITRRFSRIPVYSDTYDNVVGYVRTSEILRQVACDEHEMPLGELKRPIRIVTEFDSLSRLFNELLAHNEQIALVVDEYGGTSGVVTMEDLIETILGLEIVDETDRDADMRELARKRWTERAREIGLIDEESENQP